MRLKDAIDQYQAIIYEVELGDNLVRLQARKDLDLLVTFLTKTIGSRALTALMKDAQKDAHRTMKSKKK